MQRVWVFHEVESKTRESRVPIREMVKNSIHLPTTKDNKIFVSLCGIDEIDLEQTIESCLESADEPDNIFFGISVQYDKLPKGSLDRFRNATVLLLETNVVLGVGLARSLSYSTYGGQQYFLQIDGHMLFEQSWDSLCIGIYEESIKYHDKIIITGYVPSWYRKNCEIVKQKLLTNNWCLSVEQNILENLDSRSMKCGQPLLSVEVGNITNLSKSLAVCEQKAISYHFAFSGGAFCYNLMPDPHIVYNGDEVTIALRAWTQGYKFVAPTKTVIYHLDKTNDDIYGNTLNWRKFRENYTDSQVSNLECYRQLVSYTRVKEILTGKITGYWGAANKQKLAEYEKFVSCDFEQFFKQVEINRFQNDN